MYCPLPLLALFASCWLAGPAPAQDVLVIDPAAPVGPASFQLLEDALAAAAPGDVLWIESGIYQRPNSAGTGFELTGKGVDLVAAPGADVQVNGRFEVRQLPAAESVAVRGVRFRGKGPVPLSPLPGGGLRLEDCAGPVWFEDCEFDGGSSFAAALQLSECDAVVLNRCDLRGRSVLEVTRPGLVAEASAVFAYDSRFEGGSALPPPTASADGGPGAAGIRSAGSQLLLSGSAVFGGGGSGAVINPVAQSCEDAREGGCGIAAVGAQSTAVRLRDSRVVPGPGGAGTRATLSTAGGPLLLVCPAAPPGTAFGGSAASISSVQQLSGQALLLDLGGPLAGPQFGGASAGNSGTLTVSHAPLVPVVVAISGAPTAAALDLAADRLLAAPYLFPVAGTTDALGLLRVDYGLTGLPGGTPPLRLYGQGLAFDPAGSLEQTGAPSFLIQLP